VFAGQKVGIEIQSGHPQFSSASAKPLEDAGLAGHVFLLHPSCDDISYATIAYYANCFGAHQGISGSVTMAELKYISSPTEIPPGQKYVLVMYGNENGNARHTKGVTITVARSQSENISELAFSAAVKSAKEIADEEGISTVFACS
jgi:hypothetical protein